MNKQKVLYISDSFISSAWIFVVDPLPTESNRGWLFDRGVAVIIRCVVAAVEQPTITVTKDVIILSPKQLFSHNPLSSGNNQWPVQISFSSFSDGSSARYICETKFGNGSTVLSRTVTLNTKGTF